MTDAAKWLDLRSVTRLLLAPEHPAYSLRPEVLRLTAILAGATTFVASQEAASDGETRTSRGVALSPTMAAMCVSDFARTVEFIRGVHAAILDVRHRFPGRPAGILYAGCGPYAPLAVPLMAVFSPAETQFTLLDIHRESIESARSIVEKLELADRVSGFEECDAASYRVHSDEPPDIILLEILRACLEAEPQVAITRHLLRQAPNAILIPEEVRVDLILTDTSREFDLKELQRIDGKQPRDRIHVATVFAVSRERVNSWDADFANSADSADSADSIGRLPAETVRIPSALDSRYQPLLFTVVRTYGNHVLRDYDSGLTAPRMLSAEGGFRPGAEIQFHYELGPHPRLVARYVNFDEPHLASGLTSSTAASFVTSMENVSLRIAGSDDDDFLFRLYAAGRELEFASAGLEATQVLALLEMQHRIRKNQYDARYDRSENWIVLLDGLAVGRCLIQREPAAWTLVDLAILPPHQGRGIGTLVLGTQLGEADRAGANVRLHVHVDNPALRLYRRLGFVVKGDGDVYLEMERAPLK